MIDNVRDLLKNHFINILEKSPAACMILVDPCGQWDIEDFEIQWCNETARRIFRRVITRGKVNIRSAEKHDRIVRNVQYFRQQMIKGRHGFVGPFRIKLCNEPSDAPIILDYFAYYLGEIGAQLPVFLFLAHEKSDRMRSQTQDEDAAMSL